MLSSRHWRGPNTSAFLAVVIVALNSCAEGLAPLSKVPAPTALTVEAVKLGTMRLTWAPVPGGDVVGYSIERRANLTGPFLPFVDQVPQSSLDEIAYLDTNLEPDTFYGYRLITITRFGDRSSPSVAAGTKSPPLPGIEVRTTSLVPSAESVDPDGYELTIVGPDTVHQTIGVAAAHRFSPLHLGVYQVSIGGIIDRCEGDGPSTQTVTVTDQTPQTVVPVAFSVTCRDPRRGEITVAVTSTGASQDPEHTISLLGQASDATLPDSVRIVSRTANIGSPSGSTRFINLLPGTYDITLEGLAQNCKLEGAVTRSVTVAALDRKTVNLNVSCSSPGGGGGGSQEPGYQYRATWTALNNGEYALELKIDMTTFNRPDIDDVTTNGVSGDPLTGAQLTLAYDPSLLVYNRSESPSVPFITAEPTINGAEPGFVSLLAGTTVLKTGNMEIVRLIFTRATGSSTGSVTTVTTLRSVTSRSAGTTLVVTPDVRINEGTIAVGPGGGGGGGTPNQSPTANANGPYTGTANTPLVLSSAGSSDPDGTIATYSWALGNGQAATGASPSVTYSAAGTYTAVLTVTDNQGATATAQTTVTISGGGGGGGGGGNPGYQYRAAWTSLAGGEYALDLRIDMTTFNRADIDDITTNGVTGDPLTGAQLSLAYDATRLAYNRFEAPSAPFINAEPTVNGAIPGTVNLLAGTTSFKTGNMGIIRIIFTRVASSPDGTVTTATTLQSVTSRSGGSTRVITPDVRVNEATLTIGAGGGGGGGGGGTPNQSPIAEANGPYTATVGAAITLSSAGSTDSDGSITSYSWALDNGQAATGASPSVTYSAAGTFTVVLTVTDDKGATSTDQATVSVSNPASTKPMIWKNVVGPVDVANNQVAITVSYDMRGNVTETPGVEVLASFKVDSLKWDPAVLQFSSINLGPNISGTSNQQNASSGNLAFQGTTSGPLAQGLITIATIRFKIVGTAGSRTTTATALGVLQGAPSTGDFVYNSKTTISEGEFITP